jgi:hypothetical protein
MKNALLLKILPVLLLAVFAIPVSAQTSTKPVICLEPVSPIISTNQVMDLSNVVTQTKVQITPKKNKAYLQSQHELSAIGICYRRDNGQIFYVDPRSDLYNRVYPSDVVISDDEYSPNSFHDTGAYLNNENTIVQVVTNRGTFQARRHPTSWFGYQWHSVMGY